jgi:hypothetical protein
MAINKYQSDIEFVRSGWFKSERKEAREETSSAR